MRPVWLVRCLSAVEPGKWYTVNRLKADVGSKIKFGRVLFAKDQKDYAVGRPYLENVHVGTAAGQRRARMAAGIGSQSQQQQRTGRWRGGPS